MLQVDQSAMTGESLPAKFRSGDLCKMGSVVKSGEVRRHREREKSYQQYQKAQSMMADASACNA